MRWAVSTDHHHPAVFSWHPVAELLSCLPKLQEYITQCVATFYRLANHASNEQRRIEEKRKSHVLPAASLDPHWLSTAQRKRKSDDNAREASFSGDESNKRPRSSASMASSAASADSSTFRCAHALEASAGQMEFNGHLSRRDGVITAQVCPLLPQNSDELIFTELTRKALRRRRQ